MSTGLKIALVVLGAIILFVLVLGGTVAGTYNSLVQLDQAVQSQGAQVQNVYQRRVDLVPNLVATVKGAANFEQQTLTAVTEARAKVGQVTSGALENVARDPQTFQRFEQAQAGLSSALSRSAGTARRHRKPDFRRANEIQRGCAGVQHKTQHLPDGDYRQLLRRSVP